MADTTNIIPGVTRMQDIDGFVGTIVYVGPVASAKDVNEHYAGIVWDDPSRGKHDGSVICRRTNQLVRHFSCPHPCGASFVRLKKLDLGVSLDANVMRSKYVTAEAPVVAPNNILPHKARTCGGREKPIEFYGELEIRARQQLEDLNSISLRRMGIARYDAAAVSLQEFQHLTTLDLAGNLLCEWKTVRDILKQFPAMENFSVAANRIGDPTSEIISLLEEDAQQAPFRSLKVLNLNQCGISSVETLVWIGKLLPVLQDLCLAHSDFSALDSSHVDGTSFQQLQVLDFTDCKLSSWTDQIVPFCSTLPRLEQLSLDDNPIETTILNTEAVPENYFPQLVSLQLAGTQIEQWHDIDGLTLLPKLNSLRFRRCPVLSSMGTGEARAVMVARIKKLMKLNASVISEKERIESEKRYVSSVACQLLQLPPAKGERDTELEMTHAEFLKNHPQFKRLMEQYKDIIAHVYATDSPRSVTSSSGGGSSKTMSSVVVNVTIQSMAPSSCQQEPLVRRLPGNLTIKRLKALCARSFGLAPDLQELHFCTEYDNFPREMDDDEHNLVYYGVSDGATIYMNEIDVEERKRQDKEVKEKREANLKEQEALDVRKQQYQKQLLK